MNNIKDLLDFQIYPNIYNRIDTVFPEFAFKRIQQGYQSTSELPTAKTEGFMQ